MSRRLTLALAALALATGCASGRDAKDATLAATEPRFSPHEGRPAGHEPRAGRATARSAAGGEDDDPWWSSLIGDFIGCLFSPGGDDPS